MRAAFPTRLDRAGESSSRVPAQPVRNISGFHLTLKNERPKELRLLHYQAKFNVLNIRPRSGRQTARELGGTRLRRGQPINTEEEYKILAKSCESHVVLGG